MTLKISVPIEGAKETISRINRQIVLAEIPLYEVNLLEKKKLEEAFIEMTGNGGDQIG